MFLSDYVCRVCEHVWEDWTKNSAAYPDSCPGCGVADKMERHPGGTITKCHDPSVRKEVLQKRSLDHSRKGMKNNLDRLEARGKIQMK